MTPTEWDRFITGYLSSADIAHVEFFLEQSDVLPSENECYLLVVSAAVHCELPYVHGDAGIVLVALGDCAAGAHYEEASFHGLLHRGHGPCVAEDVVSVLGSVHGGLPDLARVDQYQVFDTEVGHASGYCTYIPFELGSDDYDADIRHNRFLSSALIIWVFGEDGAVRS